MSSKTPLLIAGAVVAGFIFLNKGTATEDAAYGGGGGGDGSGPLVGDGPQPLTDGSYQGSGDVTSKKEMSVVDSITNTGFEGTTQITQSKAPDGAVTTTVFTTGSASNVKKAAKLIDNRDVSTVVFTDPKKGVVGIYDNRTQTSSTGVGGYSRADGTVGLPSMNPASTRSVQPNYSSLNYSPAPKTETKKETKVTTGGVFSRLFGR